VFFLPSVISFSASLCASLALGHVVVIVSCSKREATKFFRSACRCAEERLSALYFICPPAMVDEGACYAGLRKLAMDGQSKESHRAENSGMNRRDAVMAVVWWARELVVVENQAKLLRLRH
jgi:hypothetical protein